MPYAIVLVWVAILALIVTYKKRPLCALGPLPAGSAPSPDECPRCGRVAMGSKFRLIEGVQAVMEYTCTHCGATFAERSTFVPIQKQAVGE